MRSASRIALGLALAMASATCFGQEPGPEAPPALSPDREAEIYKAAKSAIAEAKNRAAAANLSIRKSVLARETDARLKAVALKFGIRKNDLERIIAAGQEADGTAAKRAEQAAKSAAKQKNNAKLDAMLAAPKPPLSASGRLAVQRANLQAERNKIMADRATHFAKVGTTVWLERPGAAGNVHICVDREAFEELKGYLVTSNTAGLKRMNDAGKAFPVPNGTKAEVLQLGGGTRTIVLREGPKAGETGLVDLDHIRDRPSVR